MPDPKQMPFLGSSDEPLDPSWEKLDDNINRSMDNQESNPFQGDTDPHPFGDKYKYKRWKVKPKDGESDATHGVIPPDRPKPMFRGDRGGAGGE